MKKEEITIISEFGIDLQVWTFCIEESDLVYLMEKYASSGSSVLVDGETIAEEIEAIYK